MNNFEFYNPVKIVFGKDQIKQLQTLVPQRKKILLLFGGGSIKKNGVYEQIQTALADHELLEFSGIAPNPQYDHLIKAVELIRKEKVEFLLAAGGGSVIDAVKFIAAAAHFEGDPWELLTKRSRSPKILPYGNVLTLAATGSEMNTGSVISRGKEKLSFGGDPRLYAQFSILDPQTTYSLSERQIGNGIVDAFVHTLEQYLTFPVDAPLQDRFSEGILQTLIEEGPKAIQIKEHYESRANLMWCATIALNGIIGVGVPQDWATHMIGHELTALHGLDHARSLAVILPSLLRVQKETKRQKLLQYANRVWKIRTDDADKTIEQAILATEDFFNSVGVPTKLRVYQFGRADIDSVVESLTSHFPQALGERKDIDGAKVRKILEMAI